MINKVKEVLKTEAEGILQLIDRLDEIVFKEMIKAICDTKGRLIVSGIGKSGIIGKKITATLNSTGTRSLFLHPVEAMHGDLGQVSSDDIFLALSYSGETVELNMVIPSIKKIGCKIISFTGNLHSSLAKQSDICIDVAVNTEACPLGLAPTASTTALLAMGDALAVVLIDEKKFLSSDFKKYHPGGSLGQRLSSNVRDIMLKNKPFPIVSENATMDQAIDKINEHGLGATLITNEDEVLIGIITDGDIRRLVAQRKPFYDIAVNTVMTKNPRAVFPDSPTYDALNTMENAQITILPVVDLKGKIKGILHLHDVLGKGEFKFNGSYRSNG